MSSGWRRAADIIIVIWLIKTIIIALAVEVPMLKYGSKWIEHGDENFLLKMTIEVMGTEVDPILVLMPKSIMLIAQIHLYVCLPLYSFLILSIIFGIERLARPLGLFIGPFLFYSLTYVMLLEIYGDIPSRDIKTFVSLNVDYFIAPIGIFLRFLASPATPSSTPITDNGKKQQ